MALMLMRASILFGEVILVAMGVMVVVAVGVITLFAKQKEWKVISSTWVGFCASGGEEGGG